VAAPTIGLACVAAILIATTIGFQTAYADRVAAGVRVMGVEVGGRTRADARALLSAEVAEMLRQPIALRAADQELETTPRDLGMVLDPDTMVEDAYQVGRQGNPLERAIAQWRALFFSAKFDTPTPAFDQSKVDGELSRMAAQVDRPAQDAHLDLTTAGDRVLATIAHEETGVRLLAPQSTQRIRQALATGIPASVDLVVETEDPGATTADFQVAKAQADRILSAPLNLAFEEKHWTLTPVEVSKMMSFERATGQPAQLVVNPSVANAGLERIVKEVQQPAQSARFEWTGNGVRTIRESQDGRSLDLEALRNQIRERLLVDDHTVTLPVAVTHPAVASSDASKLAIQGLIKEGRTYFAGSVPEKQFNIGLAASRLNGTVVPPGAIFSFNNEVGPTTLDAGFKTGWGIQGTGGGAQTVPSVAGGICQVATTLFHPVFHSGYQIEERHWHLYWIPGYGQPPLGMQGLDATVDEDSGLDFQFKNTTSDYLLIQSRVEGSTIIFGLYGTKPSWNVKIEGPVITDVVPADRTPVEQDEKTMPVGRRLAVESAFDGFVSTITRTVTQDNEQPRILRLRSNYIPSRNVTLIGTGRS